MHPNSSGFLHIPRIEYACNTRPFGDEHSGELKLAHNDQSCTDGSFVIELGELANPEKRCSAVASKYTPIPGKLYCSLPIRAPIIARGFGAGSSVDDLTTPALLLTSTACTVEESVMTPVPTKRNTSPVRSLLDRCAPMRAHYITLKKSNIARKAT